MLILTLGVILPIFKTIQDERCSLAFSKVIESDLLLAKSIEQIITEQTETIDYLMKHPKQTLKNCVEYETQNPENPKSEILIKLAGPAYKKITNEDLPKETVCLNKTIQISNPELYEELVAKK